MDLGIAPSAVGAVGLVTIFCLTFVEILFYFLLSICVSSRRIQLFLTSLSILINTGLALSFRTIVTDGSFSPAPRQRVITTMVGVWGLRLLLHEIWRLILPAHDPWPSRFISLDRPDSTSKPSNTVRPQTRRGPQDAHSQNGARNKIRGESTSGSTSRRSGHPMISKEIHYPSRRRKITVFLEGGGSHYVWTFLSLFIFIFVTPLPSYFSLLADPDDVRLPDLWEGNTDSIGVLVVVVGFLIEATADFQRHFYRLKGMYPPTGLWTISPVIDFFGQVLVWIGIFVVIAGGIIKEYWQWALAVSPVLLVCMLIFASSITPLERALTRKYDPEADKLDRSRVASKTSVFFPWPPLLRRGVSHIATTEESNYNISTWSDHSISRSTTSSSYNTDREQFSQHAGPSHANDMETSGILKQLFLKKTEGRRSKLNSVPSALWRYPPEMAEAFVESPIFASQSRNMSSGSSQGESVRMTLLANSLVAVEDMPNPPSPPKVLPPPALQESKKNRQSMLLTRPHSSHSVDSLAIGEYAGATVSQHLGIPVTARPASEWAAVEGGTLGRGTASRILTEAGHCETGGRQAGPSGHQASLHRIQSSEMSLNQVPPAPAPTPIVTPNPSQSSRKKASSANVKRRDKPIWE